MGVEGLATSSAHGLRVLATKPPFMKSAEESKPEAAGGGAAEHGP